MKLHYQGVKTHHQLWAWVHHLARGGAVNQLTLVNLTQSGRLFKHCNIIGCLEGLFLVCSENPIDKGQNQPTAMGVGTPPYVH